MKDNFNLSTLVRENVRQLEPYSSARDEYTTDARKMIFLDANENPFENGINRYPDPQQWELKRELAKQKGARETQILLGNGSDEVLDLLFRAFCEPQQDNVITLPPTYGMYKVLAKINNVEEREVLLNKDYEPNTKSILEKIDEHTKMVFLCSPNNPTGNSFSEASVLEILESFEGLVVIDEAYIDFSANKSWLEKLEKYPNLVVTQTLSKAYGMAGIRIGICYAAEEIIKVLNKIKPPYNINELSQKRALDRLREKENVGKEIQMIIEQRMFLASELKKLNYVEKIYPSDANFLLIKVDDAAKRYKEILSRGVVIRNRSSQPLCENTLRLTVGTAEENRAILKIMNEIQEISKQEI